MDDLAAFLNNVFLGPPDYDYDEMSDQGHDAADGDDVGVGGVGVGVGRPPYITLALRREMLRFVPLSNVDTWDIENCGTLIKRLLLLPSFRPEHLQHNPRVFYTLRASVVVTMVEFLSRLMEFKILLNDSIAAVKVMTLGHEIETSDEVERLAVMIDRNDSNVTGRLMAIRFFLKTLAASHVENGSGKVLLTSCSVIAKIKAYLPERAVILQQYLEFVKDCQATDDVLLFRQRCKSMHVAPFRFVRSSHQNIRNFVQSLNVDRCQQMLDEDVSIMSRITAPIDSIPNIPPPDYDHDEALGKQWIRDMVKSLRSTPAQRKLNCNKVWAKLIVNPEFSFTKDLSNPKLFHEVQRRILQTYATYLHYLSQYDVIDDIAHFPATSDQILLDNENDMRRDANDPEVETFKTVKQEILELVTYTMAVSPTHPGASRSLQVQCKNTRTILSHIKRSVRKLPIFSQLLTRYVHTHNVQEFRQLCKNHGIAPFRLKRAPNVRVQRMLDDHFQRPGHMFRSILTEHLFWTQHQNLFTQNDILLYQES